MPTTSTTKKATKKTTAKTTTVRTTKPNKSVEEEREKVEKNTVAMQFSIDPSYPPDYQYFEMMIDGVLYCYPRGEVVEIPKKIYDIVKEREDIFRKSRASYEAYTRPEGANIT